MKAPCSIALVLQLPHVGARGRSLNPQSHTKPYFTCEFWTYISDKALHLLQIPYAKLALGIRQTVTMELRRAGPERTQKGRAIRPLVGKAKGASDQSAATGMRRCHPSPRRPEMPNPGHIRYHEGSRCTDSPYVVSGYREFSERAPLRRYLNRPTKSSCRSMFLMPRMPESQSLVSCSSQEGSEG